jgi:hypothetical protein
MGKVKAGRKRQPKTYETINQYRGQHDEMDVERIDPNDIRAKRVRVLRPNRLRKYLGMKSITLVQCEAGELLAAQWERAGLRERVTSRYATGGACGNQIPHSVRDLTAGAVDAHRAVQAALRGDRAPYADLLVSVCCHDEGVRNTRRLSRALTALAVHFGLVRRYPHST